MWAVRHRQTDRTSTRHHRISSRCISGLQDVRQVVRRTSTDPQVFLGAKIDARLFARSSCRLCSFFGGHPLHVAVLRRVAIFTSSFRSIPPFQNEVTRVQHSFAPLGPSHPPPCHAFAPTRVGRKTQHQVSGRRCQALHSRGYATIVYSCDMIGKLSWQLWTFLPQSHTNASREPKEKPLKHMKQSSMIKSGCRA
jgi:hypothetical protein